MSKEQTEEKLFYLSNNQGGATVGNSLKWWAINNRGYTCDLRCARVFRESELNDLRKCDIPYPKEVVDNLVQWHVDFQDLRPDNTGAYVKNPHTLRKWRPDICK